MIGPRRRPAVSAGGTPTPSGPWSSTGPVVLLSAVLACACSAPAPPPGPVGPPSAAPRPVLQFSYEAMDGTPVSTESLSKRVTVIGLLTTYDIPSQIVARFLASLSRTHTPRLNVVALMLEGPENKPLVEAFAASLGLPYPIALADAATIAGEGPFAGLHDVPSVVILDREGREAWRHVGFVDQARLEAAVKAVEQGR
jgi:hypothetical protein